MIALVLLVLSILYLGLLIWVGFATRSWLARITVWLILLSPPGYVVWTYHAIQYEHKQACANEGGLRVFIQPEKADRVQLDREALGESAAKRLLHVYSPDLALVEASDGKFNDRGERNGYFAYSPDPATTTLPKRDWAFKKVPLDRPSADLYVLSESYETDDGHRNRTIWTLKREDKLYASWTMLEYLWANQGVARIGWQCFGPDSPEWMAKYPVEALVELILK